ncbi:uncharacterized protein DSM5745_05833 [Aspergillus mulundensis]|uniref:NmrA-like domain-containing protein n=1 Tax=Aspergillus mulundensis TaxID=1810919 RepID=A0A3D8RYS6_9EURO|nr:Uncharacterized protein DSM5745_05833 [Aspergillus mulundensis]RDW78981.1 Uncharacterized protein DSM5745_05833 [Aspergillus mulundensis]
MAVIAVAGGTGGVGKTIVDVLTQEAKHEVIVLTRKAMSLYAFIYRNPSNGPQIQENSPILSRAKQVEVNYKDVSALTQTLNEHKVHTIISAISLYSEDDSEAQLNLIRAAEDAPETKRFMPSEYSFIQTEDLLPLDPSIKYFLDAANLLKSSRLHYTRVIPGFFMDYWGMPHTKTNLSPMTIAVDMGSCEAAIPGDGDDGIAMTYSYDMARFIARLLETDAEGWGEFSGVVGDRVTYNRLVGIGEKIRGRKFKVVYDSADKVKQGAVTVPRQPVGNGYSQEDMVEATALMDRLVIGKVFEFPAAIQSKEGEVLDLVKVEQFVREAWDGRA